MLNKIVFSFLVSLFFSSSVFGQSGSDGILKSFDDKNKILSSIVSAVLDIYLQTNGYGELHEFAINNKSKKIFFKTKLAGEERPLSVSVGKYELLKEEGKLFFVCKEVSTDREWLNIAAKNFLKERKIEIPSKYSILISTVM